MKFRFVRYVYIFSRNRYKCLNICIKATVQCNDKCFYKTYLQLFEQPSVSLRRLKLQISHVINQTHQASSLPPAAQSNRFLDSSSSSSATETVLSRGHGYRSSISSTIDGERHADGNAAAIDKYSSRAATSSILLRLSLGH